MLGGDLLDAHTVSEGLMSCVHLPRVFAVPKTLATRIYILFVGSFEPLVVVTVTFMPFGGFSISPISISHTVASVASGREASEKKRAEARRGQGQCWGEAGAGDGARELLRWTANPGAQKHFDPEHPLVGDSKGSSLVLVLHSLGQYSVCCGVSSHYVPRTHHPILHSHSCPRARHETLYGLRGATLREVH